MLFHMIREHLHNNMEARRKEKVKKINILYFRINKQLILIMRIESLVTHVSLETRINLNITLRNMLKWIHFLNILVLLPYWPAHFPIRRPIWFLETFLPQTQFWCFQPQSYDLISWWPLIIRTMVMWIHQKVRIIINFLVHHNVPMIPLHL